MYIDLDDYLTHGGRGMTDAAFFRAEFRAEKILDRLTQGRIRTMEKVPEAVKRLMVELVTLEATQGGELAVSPPVRSFSNDGYSETYAEPLTAQTVKQLEQDLILEYLSEEKDDSGTPLLYLGVS